MRDLNDLRHELRTRASGRGSTSMDDRLAGVRQKVAVTRRRKQVAGGVAALASLAAIGLTWSQFVPGGDDSAVAGQEFAKLPDQLNGDLLIAATYNEAGASQLQWDVTLDNRNVVATITCQIPEGAEVPNPDQPVQLAWRAGSSEMSWTCGAYGSSDAQATVATRRSEWRDAGVKVDQLFEIDLRLQQGGRDVEIPGARFGVGLYEKTADREREHGVELTTILDIDGERYRLADYDIQPLESSSRQVRLLTDEANGQIAVVYGWQADLPAASYELRQDGETLRTGYGGSVDGPVLIDGAPHELSLRAAGSSMDGALVLAYYTLDD